MRGLEAWLPQPNDAFSRAMAEGNRIRWRAGEMADRLGCDFSLAHRLVLKQSGAPRRPMRVLPLP